MERRCWVNFQCRCTGRPTSLEGVVRWCWVNFSAGASYNLDTVGQGPTALAVGASGVWQAKCKIIQETKVYKVKTMV